MNNQANQNTTRPTIANLCAIIGGFVLSFLGLGILWAGIPWQYQWLMLFPFALLTFVVTKLSRGNGTTFQFVLFGAAPIGALLTLFRDKNDSHSMPILIVIAWVIGILSGHFLAKSTDKPAI